jgi:hypothetical protein
MTRESEVKVFATHLYCDDCGTKRVHTGMRHGSCSTKYEYTCRPCKTVVVSYDEYPMVRYERIT